MNLFSLITLGSNHLSCTHSHPLFVISFETKESEEIKVANLPPAPPKLPIISNLHQIGNGNHHSLWNLSKKYGPAMLLQLGRVQVLVISSPQMAKEVLKNHDVECCMKPKLHAQKKLTYNFLTVAFSSYNDSWRQMHKLFMTELFIKSKMQSFECVRKISVTQLTDSITQNSPNSIDLSEKVLTLTYSIIYHIVFNRDYEEMEGGKLKELNEEAMQILGMILTVDILPLLGGIVDAIMGLPRRIKKSYHRFDSLLERLLDEQLDLARPKLEQEDIVDVMLKILKDENSFHSN